MTTFIILAVLVEFNRDPTLDRHLLGVIGFVGGVAIIVNALPTNGENDKGST